MFIMTDRSMNFYMYYQIQKLPVTKRLDRLAVYRIASANRPVHTQKEIHQRSKQQLQSIAEESNNATEKNMPNCFELKATGAAAETIKSNSLEMSNDKIAITVTENCEQRQNIAQQMQNTESKLNVPIHSNIHIPNDAANKIEADRFELIFANDDAVPFHNDQQVQPAMPQDTNIEAESDEFAVGISNDRAPANKQPFELNALILDDGKSVRQNENDAPTENVAGQSRLTIQQPKSSTVTLTVTTIKQFKCQFCNFSTARKSSLTNHSRKHSDERFAEHGYWFCYPTFV